MRNLFEKQAFTLALRLAPEQKCRLRLLQDSRNKNGRSAEQQDHHPQHQQDPWLTYIGFISDTFSAIFQLRSVSMSSGSNRLLLRA
jgi:hypothetical protein